MLVILSSSSASLSVSLCYDYSSTLRMRLPDGRYEVWGISQGYDCEYPLEMHVRPFSKFKLHARLALRKVDGADSEAGEAADKSVAADAGTVETVGTVGSKTLPRE
jgi:hypothetical protein